MASKFMANAVFKARPLLWPALQRNALPRTVLTLEYHALQTLSSRLYSDSNSPFPKSPRRSESSRDEHERKSQFSYITWGDAWDKSKWFLAGGFVTALIVYAIQSFWEGWYQAYRKSEFESACVSATSTKLREGPIFQKTVGHRIPREHLVEEVKKIITPREEGRSYPLVVGEHGTGKTSLIEFAVDRIHGPKGVAYVDIQLHCSSEVAVVKAFQTSLGWSRRLQVDPSKRNYSSIKANGLLATCLDDVLEIFSRSSTEYKQKYKKQPVLIVDHVDRLAQEQPYILDILQDYAKVAADKRIAIVVFVSGEGRVPRRMMERSSWSRRGGILEIGDVSKEEALQYLGQRNINKEIAEQIYEIVGGRIVHLNFFVDNLGRTGSFETTRRAMFRDAKSKLKSAGVYPSYPRYKEGATVIRELLQKGYILNDALSNLVGADIGDMLLESNVFAYYPDSEDISFQSTVMKRFCEENSDLWKPSFWW